MLGIAGGSMGRLFSDDDVKEKEQPQVVRLPPGLWERLSRIAELETSQARAEKPKALMISRNDVIRRVLSDFADGYGQDESKKGKRGH